MNTCKNPQQNTCKQNSATYQKFITPLSSWFCSRDVRIVQHTKTNKHNTTHEENTG
jgi:hypothetical protein